jgi:hypothetical protein
MYYLRTRPAADAIKFTVDVEMLLKDAGQIEVKNLIPKSPLVQKENQLEDEVTPSKKVKTEEKKKSLFPTCSDPDNCISCGS